MLQGSRGGRYMLNILCESKTYKILKKIYIVLILSFRETFIYKMFLGGEKYSFSDSFTYKILEFFKNFFIKINNAVTNSYSYNFLRKFFCVTTLSDIIDGSAALKLFRVSGEGYSFSFFMFLILIFSAAIIPTMATVFFIFVVAAFIILEKDPMAHKHGGFIFTDALIVFYLIALTYGLCISKSADKLNVFLVYAAFVGFYYIVRYFVNSRRRAVLFASYFTLAGAFVCLYAFYQYLTGSMGTESWTDTKMFEAIELRVYSTFQNPNVLGEYLLFLIPISFSMIAIAKEKFHKFVYSMIFAAAVATIFLTYSRGCWIGLITGAFLYAALLYRKVMLAAIVAAPFSIFVLPKSILTRFQSIGNLNDSSTTYRVSIWRGTVELLKKIWPSGAGLGNYSFERAYMPYAYSGVTAQHSHNSYLHILAETGIFGFSVMLLILYRTLTGLFSAYKKSESRAVRLLAVSVISGLAGYLVQGFFDNTFYNYRMYLFFFIIVAFANSLSAISRRREC
jgi:O-antigen ligase